MSPLLGVLAVNAFVFLGLAGTSLGAVTPHLVVSSTAAGPGQTLTISASKPMADDAVGRVQLFVPTGFPLELARGRRQRRQGDREGGHARPRPGRRAGADRHDHRDRADRRLRRLRGLELRPEPASRRVDGAAERTEGQPPFSFPIFVDATSGANTAFGPYVLVACFRPADVAAGTPNRSANGAVIDSFTLSLTPFARPTTAGDYRWRSLWTPFAAGNGTLNTAGDVEAQSIVTIPAGQVVIFGKKSTARSHGKTLVRVLVTGQVLVGGEPVGPVLVTIRHGISPSKLVSLGTVEDRQRTAGTRSSSRCSTKTEYFQASAHVPAKDLGASGCQASFPGVPCVDATAGAGQRCERHDARQALAVHSGRRSRRRAPQRERRPVVYDGAILRSGRMRRSRRERTLNQLLETATGGTQRPRAPHDTPAPVRAARPGDVRRRLPGADGGDVLRGRSLVSARAPARDPHGRVPDPDVHRLPRLRPRLVPALEARERHARRGAGRLPLHALRVVAPQARRAPRDDGRPRPAGRRRHPDPDDRRVSRPALVGSARLPARSATRS